MLHDRAEDGRLDMLPLGALFADGDEVAAEEHPGHALDPEQALGEGRALGLVLGPESAGLRQAERLGRAETSTCPGLAYLRSE